MTPKLKDLSAETVKKLLAVPDKRTTQGKRNRAILALLARTGMRGGELSRLTVADVVLDGPESYVVVKTLKRKQPHQRTIPLTPDTVAALRAYLSSRNGTAPPESPLFLTTGKHGPWRPRAIRRHVVARLLRKAAKRAKIAGRLTPHSLRHNLATQALRAGADLRTVQELLGHASIGSTQVYLHPSAARMAEAVRALPF